jgi:hypothetical protein
VTDRPACSGSVVENRYRQSPAVEGLDLGIKAFRTASKIVQQLIAINKAQAAAAPPPPSPPPRSVNKPALRVEPHRASSFGAMLNALDAQNHEMERTDV